MTTPDNLFSQEELEEIICDGVSLPYSETARNKTHVNLAQQLLNTMRENELLKQMLDSHAYANHSSKFWKEGATPPDGIQGLVDASKHTLPVMEVSPGIYQANEDMGPKAGDAWNMDGQNSTKTPS